MDSVTLLGIRARPSFCAIIGWLIGNGTTSIGFFKGETMRTSATLVTLGIFALAVGCGGSSSNGDGGSGGIISGNGGMLGGGGISGSGGAAGGASGTCNYPTCLASLATTCAPSGTCTQQTDPTTYATNTCYSNGVKTISSVNLTTLAVTLTYKKGGSTCYSVDVAGISTGSLTMTFKNASGGTLGTGTMDAATNALTITCAGAQPVTLDAACDTSSFAGASNCTTGTCTP